MSADVSQPGNNAHQPAHIAAMITATTVTGNDGNENNFTLSGIKLLCTEKKKRRKHNLCLIFVESCPLSAPIEQSCIDIVGKTNASPILLDECISCEYFDAINNDFQSFIYIYFESYTVSIYFSNEHSNDKALVIKHLEYVCQKKAETNEQVSSQGLPCQPITEHIVHTFDVKLIPHETIITRDHVLIGQVRLYFTTTDLYIAAIDCSAEDLKKTITNQCPAKDKTILCIPYFTIKHYGNRSNIFLIELGKSNYGNGEIHMKCLSSSLASTIHLLVSPVIEERPLALSSAFQNQLLTSRRIEKLKQIHPPVQLTHDATSSPAPATKKRSLDTLSSDLKPRSVGGFFRKLLKTSSALRRSKTFNVNREDHSEERSIISPPLISTQFFQLDTNVTQSVATDQLPTVPSQLQLPLETSKLSANAAKHEHPVLSTTFNKQDAADGTYLDMDPPSQRKSDPKPHEEVKNEEINRENTATVDIGVNTMITIPPSIRSAIIVENAVHMIAEEKAVFPFGQRSFTSPANVMQPFKAQLNRPTTLNTCLSSTGMMACTPSSSSSSHHLMSTSNSQQSLLVSYGIITFNEASILAESRECCSSLSSDDPATDRRLYSDLSLMSTTRQQQPANIYSLNGILSSSSSSSHIFRTLSLSTTNNRENSFGPIPSSNGGIVFFDESLVNQTTSYLLGPALPLPSNHENTSQTDLPRLSSASSMRSASRSHLSHIAEEKSSSNDPYASLEPLSLCQSPASSLSTILSGPSLAFEKSVDYTDVLLPSIPGDSQQDEVSASDDTQSIEEKNEQSSTILYTGIDFHQSQRRDRIAQFAAKAKIEDQAPPFVL